MARQSIASKAAAVATPPAEAVTPPTAPQTPAPLAKAEAVRSRAMELLAQHAAPAPLVMAEPKEISNAVPYVGFFYPDCDDGRSLLAAFPDMTEPQTYIKYPDGRYERLRSFRFIALNGWRYWAKYDKKGNMIAGSLVEPDRNSDMYNKEQVIIPMFVFRDDGKLIAAKTVFRTVKSNAGSAALNTIPVAASADWGGYSPFHRATLAIPYPAMRFATTVTCKYGVSRSTGNPYWAAKGNPQPLGAVEITALMDFLKTDDGLKGMVQTDEMFKSQVAFVTDQINKLNAAKPAFN